MARLPRNAHVLERNRFVLDDSHVLAILVWFGSSLQRSCERRPAPSSSTPAPIGNRAYTGLSHPGGHIESPTKKDSQLIGSLPPTRTLTRG